jgi:hypothetical protein
MKIKTLPLKALPLAIMNSLLLVMRQMGVSTSKQFHDFF